MAALAFLMRPTENDWAVYLSNGVAVEALVAVWSCSSDLVG
jgi:hypothetical protein